MVVFFVLNIRGKIRGRFIVDSNYEVKSRLGKENRKRNKILLGNIYGF